MIMIMKLKQALAMRVAYTPPVAGSVRVSRAMVEQDHQIQPAVKVIPDFGPRTCGVLAGAECMIGFIQRALAAALHGVEPPFSRGMGECRPPPALVMEGT
jgi:hypothetical protein